MREKTEPTKITLIEELVAEAELTSVIPYEVSAKRIDGGEWKDEPASSIGVAIHVEPQEIAARMTQTVDTGEAVLVADFAICYTLNQPLDIPQPIAVDFVERVAVMALIPFVRESIFTSAARLGMKAPLLAMVRQGQITLGEADTP